ncbi:uncharacterized protein LOC128983934 [Macrosteles quadrilineatus]|uniref:uncharacterized protein LOC128983934 n=1 Tax=Macrosteles quadrilineatus TaxID=74068 RepID=UPI0023E20ECD|nr:uncharacterized protein LOC128983934 [Macrosteles quadrilineatus]
MSHHLTNYNQHKLDHNLMYSGQMQGNGSFWSGPNKCYGQYMLPQLNFAQQNDDDIAGYVGGVKNYVMTTGMDNKQFYNSFQEPAQNCNCMRETPFHDRPWYQREDREGRCCDRHGRVNVQNNWEWNDQSQRHKHKQQHKQQHIQQHSHSYKSSSPQQCPQCWCGH